MAFFIPGISIDMQVSSRTIQILGVCNFYWITSK